MIDEEILAVARIHQIWRCMISRCVPGRPGSNYHGDRGISVCEGWSTFIPFYHWALANGYASALSIDRIDNGGNYTPENCRWATSSEQGVNRCNVKLTHMVADDIRFYLEHANMSTPEIGKVFGISGRIVRGIKAGIYWKPNVPVEALGTPPLEESQVWRILRIHRIWVGMHKRCTPGGGDAKNHGDRGITVCEGWGEFITFAIWSLANGYADTLSIDRIDNDGNYSPENCRWSTAAQQAQNKRNTKLNWGKVDQIRMLCREANLSQREIGKIFGVCRWTVRNIKSGKIWQHPDFVRKPKKDRQRPLLTPHSAKVVKVYLAEANLTHREIGKIFGVSRGAISSVSQGRTWKNI